MENEIRYNEMRAAYVSGKITTAEWVAFCTSTLYIMMEKHKEVFIRLKNV